MFFKPPNGISRGCWNVYDGKHKKKYPNALEAEQSSKNKPGYQAYYCRQCTKFHIGRISKRSKIQEINRQPELELELGARVVAHMRHGDTVDMIKQRFRTAWTMQFRRPKDLD